MPTRTARTAWNGGLQDGSGQVELSSSKVGTYDVSFPNGPQCGPECRTVSIEGSTIAAAP